MKKYTIGILFNEQFDKVVLILKNRPDWQRGKFNFPGGHIEKGELPEECVSREFKEECNIHINPDKWFHIGTIRNKRNYNCEILTSIDDGLSELKTMEDQNVTWVDIDKLPDNVISNLRWLIPFAYNYWNQGNADNLSFGLFD